MYSLFDIITVIMFIYAFPQARNDDSVDIWQNGDALFRDTYDPRNAHMYFAHVVISATKSSADLPEFLL